MKLIEPSYEIEHAPEYETALDIIECAARTCYKSEDKICEGSAERLIRSCIKRGHESVLEHCSITVRIICDRGVSHELVRHRLASYSQESQRYCAYKDEIEVIRPIWFGDLRRVLDDEFLTVIETAEKAYLRLLALGAAPQSARAVLPNATKTEIVMSCNIREWRHVFKLRCDKAAHPEMRRIMLPMRDEFIRRWPVFFEDLIRE